MQTFFRYNWIVREQWYQWCEGVPSEELLKARTGGVGSILKTLFHIADVEYSWIQFMLGGPDFQDSFEMYGSLDQVRTLDRRLRHDVEAFVTAWDSSMETRPLYDVRPDGTSEVHAWGEVMRHVIAHEIHHIGQLSVWAREIGRAPVSANLIRKGLIKPSV
ncbi:DinB family protein [Cohnella hashimotonis]|uniref:DinB family protein n=1 Tax=Cohnella hashimotonis TaxID=2826895 RepID=A0ABT6TS01_9BACL|nr:DinB family protein [Cohnella hashimotonis]MDI4649306.1 DinB family protein [Cohnella hashimotonis]